MNEKDMAALFRKHRDAEAARDIDAIVETFAPDCYLETVALGTRSAGRDACRNAYVSYFTAFPDLAPEDIGESYGDNVYVTWGFLNGTHTGEWLGVPGGGGAFRVPFTNVTTFNEPHMLGETIYFDLATLCEQAGTSLDAIRAAAAARRASS